uniref:Uncharacterized protein ycf20 n=1 Tax=Yamadaella caenomyce TaxID=259029 RepID=A0A1G4NYJ9_9FLOR|nr:Hypothetical protein ycf20 [Yamadaella caenomyce]SCW23763.1 Hypothetical protein ycf20 [Yamadaella caenomyce]
MYNYQTKVAELLKTTTSIAQDTANTPVYYLSISLLYMLLGFFISSTISTVPGQTGDWGIVGGAIIVTFYERISQQTYPQDLAISRKMRLIDQINCIKVGILYGFFVDAFKLGS